MKAFKKMGKKLVGCVMTLALLATLVGQMPVGVSEALADDSSGQITQSDFLKASGTDLKNNYGTGDTVVLRGVNAGGWLVQEPWMCATEATTNVSCQTDIINMLTSRFGESGANDLLAIYEDNYWSESDFDNCKDMGMNVIRLPFWYKNIVDDNGNVKSDAFTRIDWFVEECAKRNMYVILDLHGAPGSQNGEVHSGDTSGIGLFEGSNASANQQLALKVWTEVASHYAGNAAVAGYDILNEPYSASNNHYTSQTVWDFYDLAYNAIRQVDPDHVLIMEATWEPSQMPNPSRYGWQNIMYEYHQYNYDSQTDADEQLAGINNKLSEIKEANYGIPSYIGETSFFSNMNSWQACLQRLNDSGINWTLWTYKVTGYNSSWGIYSQNISSANLESDSYDQIAQKWGQVGTASPNPDVYNLVKQYLANGVSQNAYGEGRYEAELADYISDGGSIRTMTSDFGTFSNDGYVEALNGNTPSNISKYTEYNVHADKAGTYEIAVGYATTTATQFGVQVNGGDWTLREVSSTGAWDSIWEATVTVYLNKGDNTIRISGAVDNDGSTWIILDYFDLSLTEADDSADVVVGSGTVRIEAEDADSYTKGSASADHTLQESANFSGGYAVGELNTWPDDGRSYLTKTVTAQKAGTYLLTVAYAGGEENHPCTIDVRVNGGSWSSIQNVTYTGGWDIVSTVQTTVELNAGDNVIDITGACNVWYDGMGWEWVNLDYFELTLMDSGDTGGSSGGTADAGDAFKVTSPTDNQLMAAGYMDITWGAANGSVKEYHVYINGSNVATTTDTTYEYYTTKVAKFNVYIEALYNDGSTAVTDTITFGVTKKGLGLATDMGENLDTKSMGIGWYYNWGTTPSSGSQYTGIEYVPMIWGANSMNSSDLNNAKNADSKYVLGFNEPDYGDQSNMSVSTVIGYWPQLMDIGKKLGSPASGTWPSINDWFQDFMGQINSSSSLDVDFIAIHCYPDNWAGSSMAEWFLTDVVDAAYEMYHKPIWITEFSTTGEWVTATGDNGTKEFWETVIPGLDEREYVERYAAFDFDSDSTGLWRYSSGELTPAGEVYASLGNPDGFTPEYEDEDYTVKVSTQTSLLDDNTSIDGVTYSDLTEESGVNITASTQLGDNVASNAIDDDISSRWESEQGVDPQSITIDLGSICDIKQIAIIWEAASAATYTIEVSDDGQNYTTVANVTSQSGDQNRLDTITFDELISGRYVRITGTSRTTVYGYSIYDLAIYGLSGESGDDTTTQESTEGSNEPAVEEDGRAWTGIFEYEDWNAYAISNDSRGYTLTNKTIGDKWYSIQTDSPLYTLSAGVTYTCTFTLTADYPKAYTVDIDYNNLDTEVFSELDNGEWTRNADGTYSTTFVGTYTSTLTGDFSIRVSLGYHHNDDSYHMVTDTYYGEFDNINITMTDFTFVEAQDSPTETTTETPTQAPTDPPTEPATESPSNAPAAPAGLVYAGNENLPIYFAWAGEDCDYFNVYVNGVYIASVTESDFNGAGYDSYFPTGVEITFGVTAVKDGAESDMTTITWTNPYGTSSETTTEQPTVETTDSSTTADMTTAGEGDYDWVVVDGSDGKYYYYVLEGNANVVNLQSNPWSGGNTGIYITVGAAITDVYVNGEEHFNDGIYEETDGAGCIINEQALTEHINAIVIWYDGGNASATVLIRYDETSGETTETVTETPVETTEETTTPSSSTGGVWNMWSSDNAVWRTFGGDESSWTITNQNIGDSWWSVQTDSPTYNLTAGKTYSCTFTLTADYGVAGIADFQKAYTVDFDAANDAHTGQDAEVFEETDNGKWTDNGDGTYSTTFTGTYVSSLDGTYRVRIGLGYHHGDDGNHVVYDNDAYYPANSSLTISMTGFEFKEVTEQTTEETTTEPTTDEPATQPSTGDGITLEGYQISTSYEGFRIVGGVEDTIDGKKVENWGFIYALSKYNGEDHGITDDEMYVRDDSPWVKCYESTSAGTLTSKMGDSDTATYFARTMKFGGDTADIFEAEYRVRAYALLEDGSYAYSNIGTFTVYDIADYLYQNLLMNTYDAHVYLYEKILLVVDPKYKEVEFDWNNFVVKP